MLEPQKSCPTGGVSFWSEVIGPHTIKSVRIRQGVLKKGAILAVVHVDSVPGESDMKMHPEIKMAPIFDIRMPKEVRGIPVLEVLRRSLWYVERTVVPSLRKFL